MKALGIVVAIVEIIVMPLALVVFAALLLAERISHRHLFEKVIQWGQWH